MNKPHALTDDEFREMLDLQRTANRSDDDDAQRLRMLIDRLVVDRHWLSEYEADEYTFLSGVLASTWDDADPALAKRLRHLNDLFQAENENEIVSGADVLAAARNVVRDQDRE
jgi:hypothetical protein